ncbi:MAG: polyhydroxyalkanoate synthesis regulator DNA-binding domain-containing protein [Pseudomonadota bacterium]|nr:polyhydroxyalkanoate synthesis regulator DNA-binding domain-containing protein [Pseudomonadota bacterium]
MFKNHLIRKYTNRRLYDTVGNRYVNLKDIQKLITEGNLITVIEQTSKRDITNIVLLQIIGIMEQQNIELLSTEFLIESIRLGSKPRDDVEKETDEVNLSKRLHKALRESEPINDLKDR